MIDPKSGERRPAKIWDVRLDHGSRDRPVSYAAPHKTRERRHSFAGDKPSRAEVLADADEIVERMVRRGVLAP